MAMPSAGFGLALNYVLCNGGSFFAIISTLLTTDGHLEQQPLATLPACLTRRFNLQGNRPEWL